MKARTLAALLLALAVSAHASAQHYPVKPIRIVVPFGAGGPNDLLSRLVGQKLTEAWGQAVIVDNRPGGGTIIGTEIAARSAPDGHTLMIAAVSHATNPSRARKLPFDPVGDFAPVILLGYSPTALIVHPSVPAKSVRDIVALAKAQPGKLNFGSGGTGTAIHLAFETLCLQSGIRMIHVPYNGQAPAILSIMRGDIPWMFAGILPTLPHIRSGRLRAVAISSAERTAVLPGVPTVAETLPGFEAVPWYGLFAPAATPKDVIAKLNDTIGRALRAPDMRERLARESVEVVAGTPEEFGAFFRAEIQKWSKVIKAAGIVLD